MSNIRITSRGGEHHAEILVEDSEMIPKSRKSSESRKAVGIHEFAALARSSLYGISQAVKEHVTKPTSLAQGRVAHLIEWKGWPKISDTTSDPLNSHFSSYCHLTEGEQEARFAAGVAEQFAIAEAKLRAWASVDDDDEEEEDSTDEDFSQSNGHTSTCPTQSSDTATSTPISQVPCQVEMDSKEAPPSPGQTNPGGSSRSSLSCDRPTSQTDAHMAQTDPPQSPSYRMGSFLKEGGLEGGKEQVVPLQDDGAGVCVIHKPDWRSSFRSSRFDSCYSTSHSESLGEEEEEEEEESVFQDEKVWHRGHGSFFSDGASSGVGSLDEGVEIEEGEERRGNKEHLF